MKPKVYAFVSILAICFSFAAKAEVTLPDFFTSGMVLQQNSVASIPCKSSKAGAVVTIESSIAASQTVTADSTGSFTYKLSVPTASKTPFWIRFKDGEGATTIINDLYAGEVWLCGGQSNMEMPVQGWGCVQNYEQEIAAADYPYIRFVQMSYKLAFSPQEEATTSSNGWQKISSSTVGNFSALAYFFGRELYKKLNIPIGLVYSAWGGTPAEAWVSYETAEAVGGFESTLSLYKECNFDRATILSKNSSAESQYSPTQCYNAMIYPLHVMPVGGVIWYQGESNVGRDTQYTVLFKSLITSWRELWGTNFPFYFVQLAGYQEQVDLQPTSQWAALRWAQQDALELENTGMATAVDIGEVNDIHPKNKQEVGRRLALVALKNTYGFDDIIDKAPELKSYSFTSNKAVLTFSGKLTVKNASAPKGFIMQSSAGGRYVLGTAELLNDSTVQVKGKFIGTPRSIRYNWADFPNGNLYGENDLPVLPFRTDKIDGLVNNIVMADADAVPQKVNVYSTEGVLLRKNVERDTAVEGLASGVYVVEREKVLVR